MNKKMILVLVLGLLIMPIVVARDYYEEHLKIDYINVYINEGKISEQDNGNEIREGDDLSVGKGDKLDFKIRFKNFL